ncbi:MAG TPA: NAD(P)/FAD-dependent oxidoreductase, partial [Acidimicrobiales bacterium]|nr:NAD(P)/FAD-dependent oxidoreductase [Acidimicrobiales bacterium]
TQTTAWRDDRPVVVIGAGPAGLTAAYQLSKAGRDAMVLEADDVVGGISRTVERDGWRFDIGGHRFFTKVQPVEELWHEILAPEDFLLRPRMSRIYYDGKFYDYPIKPLNALRNLGLVEAVCCAASYLKARVLPPKDQSTLEGYIVANYGWRLYEHFFKTYNEKVWGVPASELSADWGAQRIKGMSLFKAVWEPMRARLAGGRRDRARQVTSLIEEFQYPKHGPGMMWEACRDLVEKSGVEVVMQAPVVALERGPGGVTAVTFDPHGRRARVETDHVVSSMPFSALVRAMDPPAPPEVLAAADDLHYRDFLTVALVVPEDTGFPDNWIYIHSPTVKVGRIQNFGSWSPHMVRDGTTCLGLEYFVFEGDELWATADDELVALATAELAAIGLVDPGQVARGYVVRMPKAYPVYDDTYRAAVQTIRRWLTAEVPNVHPVGRNGMHKYNNQDHSMYTAMLTVENIVDGAGHDIWSVNVDEVYHEEKAGSPGDAGTGRDAPVVPRRVAA